jgi:hypothetical protein
MDFIETKCDNVDWIYLAQDKDQRNKPLGSTEGGEFLD